MLWQIRLLFHKYSLPPPDLHEYKYFPAQVMTGLAHVICLANGMWQEQVLKMYLSGWGYALGVYCCHEKMPWEACWL